MKILIQGKTESVYEFSDFIERMDLGAFDCPYKACEAYNMMDDYNTASVIKGE